jgi:hypothetical protein
VTESVALRLPLTSFSEGARDMLGKANFIFNEQNLREI